MLQITYFDVETKRHAWTLASLFFLSIRWGKRRILVASTLTMARARLMLHILPLLAAFPVTVLRLTFLWVLRRPSSAASGSGVGVGPGEAQLLAAEYNLFSCCEAAGYDHLHVCSTVCRSMWSTVPSHARGLLLTRATFPAFVRVCGPRRYVVRENEG